MTDREKLEEIKSRVWKDKGTYAMGDYSQREGYIYTLSDYDYHWLIQQAEKIELLNAEIETLQAKWEVQGLMIQKLHRENKRYRKALEFYADEKNHKREWDTFTDSGVEKSEVMKDGGEKARKALGWEEEK